MADTHNMNDVADEIKALSPAEQLILAAGLLRTGGSIRLAYQIARMATESIRVIQRP